MYSSILYQDPEIRTFTVNTQILPVVAFSEFDNFKLVRIVLVKKRDWNAHQAIVIPWNILGLVYINAVAIVVLRIIVFITSIFL